MVHVEPFAILSPLLTPLPPLPPRAYPSVRLTIYRLGAADLLHAQHAQLVPSMAEAEAGAVHQHGVCHRRTTHHYQRARGGVLDNDTGEHAIIGGLVSCVHGVLNGCFV